MRLRTPLACLVLAGLAATGCRDADVESAAPLAPEARSVPSAAAASVIATENLPPHPESAVHDPVADAYLVSNLGTNTGSGAISHLFDTDDNGFISRVELNSDGTVTSVTDHWIGHPALDPDIEADVDGVTGITIRGRDLYAVDRDEILVFDLDAGTLESSVPLPASGVAASADLSLPNDVVVEADGTIWLTDTGLDASAGRTHTDAVWSFDPGTETWTKEAGGTPGSSDLGCPNGLAMDGSARPLFLTFCSNSVERIASGGVETVVTVEGPATGVGRLDGLVRQKNGKLLFSDWRLPQGGEGVLRWVSPDGNVDRVTLDDLNLPADIGFDARRQRVLVPSDGDRALKVVRGGG